MGSESLFTANSPEIINELRMRMILNIDNGVNVHLGRYLSLLNGFRLTMGGMFTRSEIPFIARVSCSPWSHEGDAMSFHRRVEDVITCGHLDERMGVDGEKLLAHIQWLNPLSYTVLVDSVERWNAMHMLERDLNPEMMLSTQ